MQPTFQSMESNYVELNAHASIVPSRERELSIACEGLIRNKAIYVRLGLESDVPPAALMALSSREMNGDIHCYLGNGQRLTMRTTIVPKNRGPFPDTHDGFVAGGMDALRLDGWTEITKQYGKWTLPLFAYFTEEWNGWGYRYRRIPSPYVYGATTVQRPGKFVRDGVFDSSVMDPQLGTLAIVEELVKQDPSLKFYDDDVPKIETPSIIPPVVPHPVMASVDPYWIQRSLNKLRSPGTPLRVDGDVGRGTRLAVREFEQRHRLMVDRGIPGPQVVAALKQALAEAGMA